MSMHRRQQVIIKNIYLLSYLKASDHIIGAANDDLVRNEKSCCEDTINGKPKTLEQDLALLSNSDRYWDNSNGNDNHDHIHSDSHTTLATITSTNAKERKEPQDAWEL